jgi:hypothetical protein
VAGAYAANHDPRKIALDRYAAVPEILMTDSSS